MWDGELLRALRSNTLSVLMVPALMRWLIVRFWCCMERRAEGSE